MRIRRTLTAFALAGVMGGFALSPSADAAPPSDGVDRSPCAKAFTDKKDGRLKQYCPLWRDRVPVYNGKDGLRVVGYLNYGGWSNWFYADIGSVRLGRVDLGGAWNGWWAATMADNGAMGYVNQVYFKGGGNDVPDAGMKRR